MVYAALSAGAGGLAYRVMEKEWGKERRDAMIDEVTTVNHEVRQIRDFMAMGFPRPIASCDHPKIQVTCIDAMPGGMVLFVINHDLQRSAPELPPAIEAQEHRNVTIKVDAPDDLQVAKLTDIHGKTRKDLGTLNVSDGQLTIVAPSVKATKLFVIEPGNRRS